MNSALSPRSTTIPLPSGCAASCAACHHRAFPLDQSLSQKQSFVERCFETAAVQATVHPVCQAVTEETRWGTRNKAVLHVRYDLEQSQWKLGVLGRRTSPSWKTPPPLIDLIHCPQHSASIRNLHAQLERLPFPPESFAWHFAVISGSLLTLVLKQRDHPSPEILQILRDIQWEGLGLQGVLLNLNPSCGNRVLDSKRFVTIWGESTAMDALTDSAYGPSTFAQVIPLLHRQTLEQAATFLIKGHTTPQGIIDLYCGTGLSLRAWSQAGLPAIGVELSSESVRLARSNAPSAQILPGKCEERIPQLQEWILKNAASAVHLYCNPPRMGLDSTLIQWVKRTPSIQRIAYLSCSPRTLARDLAVLQSDFQIINVQPYDFFPNTHHIETLALLVRKSGSE